MDWFLPLLGGLGIGSAATAFINSWLSGKREMKKRIFAEKREAYYGLLDAMYYANLERDADLLKYPLSLLRVRIIGSKGVIRAAERFKEAQPHSPEKKAAEGDMVEEMRKDLGF